MIMCFTYMQEPYERDKPLKSTNITEQSGSQIQEKKDEENGTNGVNIVLEDPANPVQGNGSRFQVRSLNFGRFEYPNYTYGNQKKSTFQHALNNQLRIHGYVTYISTFTRRI